jgi:plastocyanin
MRMRYLVLLLALTGCSDENKKAPDAATPPKDAAIDAKPIDAPPDAQAFVLKVDCATVTPVQTVTTVGFTFSPMDITIALDDVVKFAMIPASNHSVAPSPSLPSDPGLVAPFNVDTCLRFTKAGKLNYVCNPHGFPGSVMVQ